MANQRIMIAVCCIVLLSFVLNNSPVEGRYLPTRANSDRLDKLRELLKDLLENEVEDDYQPDARPRWHPESKLFYKREIPSQ